MTKAETKSVVALLLALCPLKQPEITRSFAEAWTAALAPYDVSEIRAAALSHARKKPYFPALSDLTRHLIPKQAARRDDLDYAEKLFGPPGSDTT